MIEVLRIAFEECYCGKFRLLDVQIFRFLKLKQRADVVSLRRINDDDALALLELLDDVIAVERGQNGHGNGDKKPEPRQTITLREKLCGIKTLARKARRRRAVAGGSFTRLEFGGFHIFQ